MVTPEAGWTSQASRKESGLINEGPGGGQISAHLHSTQTRTWGQSGAPLLGRPLPLTFGFDSSRLHRPCACSPCSSGPLLQQNQHVPQRVLSFCVTKACSSILQGILEFALEMHPAPPPGHMSPSMTFEFLGVGAQTHTSLESERL